MAVFSELRGNQRAEDSLSGGLVCNASRLGTLGWQQVAHVVLRLIAFPQDVVGEIQRSHPVEILIP